uniref:TOG domain-containing protein n=1 Tax=Parastrongyloides trichosuri TaxID=131310 RepID=A0A0N4ZZG2_PARTI
MADLGHFYELIKRILCTDNEIRKEAEAAYEGISILVRCQLLFQLYSKVDCDIESRNMSLVLLRRLLCSDYNEMARSLGNDNINEFREKCLEAVINENDNGLRKRLVEVVAEFGRESIDPETLLQRWEKIIKFIAHAPSANAELKEAAMLLIENVPNIFGEQMPNYISDIKTIFHSCLCYNDKLSVRTSAVKAFVAFVVEHENLPKIIQPLADQVPFVLEVCKHVVATEEDDCTVIQSLCDMASTTPKLINPHLISVLEFCHSTCLKPDIDESYRHSALEVMVAFSETSASVIRKRAAGAIPEMVKICMTLMTAVDEDISEWCVNDSPDAAEDEEEDYTVGESSLDRFSCALGGKSLLQPLLSLAGEYLKSSDWKYRHAAIMALSVSGEGCKRQMEPIIENIISTILPYLKDDHPRVRYAACNAIGQMSTDFGPTLQKKCHATVVPALLETLIDLSNARVSAHAGAALVNFSEECPKNVISLYLTDIIAKLEFVLENTFKQLLEKGKKIVLEQVITTVASVADAAKDQFIAYYDRLIPPLKYILKNTTAPEHKVLRGKTIECISLIGLAVGPEKFEPDVNEIMEVLLSSQTEEISNDDPLLAYMISSWARICKILGEKFGRYLPMVMPAVMKAASLKPDVMLLDEDSADQNADEYDNWSFMNLGDNQSLGIKTSGLEEKSTACEMIVCYAREAKAAFIDYVEPVMELMLPLLKFMFHDVVRMSAAEAMPVLLEVALPKGVEYIRKMWETILPAFREALSEERDSDVIGVFLEELGSCVEIIGANVVNIEELEIMTSIINHQMEEYSKRKVLYEEQLKDEDADEEAQEQIDDYLENETNILGKTSDIIHSLFKTFGAQYLPYFEKIGKHFAEIIVDKKRQFYERQWAICVFDDVIEYGGPQSLQYREVFLNPILDYLGDEYPEIRQAAAYGCGMMGLKGGPGYAEACREAIPRLINIIQRPEARSTEEECAATENAISAVAKILKCNSSLINVNDIIPVFMSWLPIWEDDEESPFVYGYLCDLIESNNPHVVGDNLPRLVFIITEAFVKGAFADSNEAEETKQRLMNILKSLKENQELFSAVVSAAGLNEEQKGFLQGSL